AAPGAPVARALSNQAQGELRQAFQEFSYR
ncbi:MAG TPA: anaerobic ribonucleoside-triphosphate reductase activating protein, partial [Achromobacter sp.]|nr:anaerobic ribonucleoside-triphosphate reductase activating protein [Achromobacter sp.]